MKKLLSLLLCACMILGFTACNCQGNNNNETGKNAKIYCMLPTEKYMRDKSIGYDEDYSLEFAGIRNEIQSAQITFTAKRTIDSFNLVVNDLKEDGGNAVISKNLFSVYAERYVEIYNPYISSADYLSEAGFYPDALVPLDKYQIREEDKVDAGNNQALWIDVNIPEDAKAGNYSGEFTLQLNDENVKLSVSLKVYDLDMPTEVNWPTLFDIWYTNIGNGEGENADEDTYERYYEFLWTKRLNCTNVPAKYSINMTAFVNYVETIWDNPKVTGYKIPSPSIAQDKICPKVAGTYTEEQIAAEQTKVKNDIKSRLKLLLDRSLELRNEDGKESVDLLKKALFYYEDEPVRGQRTDCVKIFCKLLHSAKNELATEYAEEFKMNPDLLESLMNVDEICPSNYFFDNSLTVSEKEDGTPDYDLSDGLTWWCPEVDYAFDKAAKREFILKRQALGEKIWWYLCCSNTPRPSYYVESLPINIRMMSWQQYRWNVKGVLYWDIASFTDDTYTDVQYENFGGGEGILVYPGVRYGSKTPISSWRLEQIRLGQQDLELFTMLENYLKESDSKISANDISIAMGDTMYRGTTIFEKTTSRQLEDYRIWILDVLQMFKSGDTSGAIKAVNNFINK